MFSLYDWPRDPLLLSALRASVMETVGHTFSFHSLDRRGVSRIRASEESGTWPISNRGKIGPRGAGRIEGEKIFGDPTLDSTIDKTPRFPLSLFAFASKTHSVLFASSLPSRFERSLFLSFSNLKFCKFQYTVSLFPYRNSTTTLRNRPSNSFRSPKFIEFSSLSKIGRPTSLVILSSHRIRPAPVNRSAHEYNW